MRKTITLCFAIGLMFCLSMTSFGSIINVPGSFSTISAAVANAVSGDSILVNSATYVINDECIEIYNKNLVIRGTGATRPIVTLVALPAGLLDLVPGNGVGIHSDGSVVNQMTVSIENLIFIPSTTDQSATRVNNAFEMNSNAATDTSFTINVNMSDLVVCPNNGFNAPVSTDGLSFVNLVAPALPFRRAAIEVVGNTNINCTRVVATNNRPGAFAGAGTRQDGFRILQDYAGFTTNINEGCVASYNDRIGIVFNDNGDIYNINGSDTAPVLILNNGIANGGNGDLTSFGGAVGQAGEGVFVNNCIIECSNQYGFLSYFNSYYGLPESFTNCVVISAGTSATKVGLALSDNPATPNYVPITIDNCTFISQSTTTPSIRLFHGAGVGSTVKTVNITNSIFASASGNGMAFDDDGTATADTVNISNSAFVTSGPNALSIVTASNMVAIVNAGSGIINADPQFLQSTSAGSADLVDVSNVIYGQTFPFSPLGGGGDYFGALPVNETANPGGDKQFSIAGGIGPYSSWGSSNLAVATISSTSNNVAFVTAVGVGTTLITVKDSLNRTSAAATLVVTPTSAPLVPDYSSSPLISKAMELISMRERGIK